MKMTGAEIIIKMLELHGVRTIAGIPGGANLPLYTALSKSSIKHILARHEQGAGFIASGMARACGKPAVCFATSGPAATNLVTAIADAWADSVPIIAITGQVPQHLLGTQAFQEVDIISMTSNIVKKNYLVSDANDLAEILSEAFITAVSGRPGPILIDIPKDVQQQRIEWEDMSVIKKAPPSPAVSETAILNAVKMIQNSLSPVLFCGGGIISGDASEIVIQFAEENDIPVVTTLMGLGAFPSNHQLFCGMIGMHGGLVTHELMAKTDCLIACGVRFDDRAVLETEKFAPHAKIIHIDVDEREIGKIIRPDAGIHGDAASVLKSILYVLKPQKRLKWISEIQESKEQTNFRETESVSNSNGFIPNLFMNHLALLLPDDTIITTDVGQHQMWTAQFYPFKKPRTFLTSGGLGTMGFGLPAAVGAALAQPGKRVVCISGDGSLFMNIQELFTLAELNLPVIIIIMNNGFLGLVRQQQELLYENQVFASEFQHKTDFSKMAESAGLMSISCEKMDDVYEAIKSALNGDEPVVIEYKIPSSVNVLPMDMGKIKIGIPDFVAG